MCCCIADSSWRLTRSLSTLKGILHSLLFEEHDPGLLVFSDSHDIDTRAVVRTGSLSLHQTTLRFEVLADRFVSPSGFRGSNVKPYQHRLEAFTRQRILRDGYSRHLPGRHLANRICDTARDLTVHHDFHRALYDAPGAVGWRGHAQCASF